MQYVRSLIAAAACGVVVVGAPAAHALVNIDTDGTVLGVINNNVFIGENPVNPPITVFADAGTNVSGSMDVFNDTTFNMSGGNVGNIIFCKDTSIVNFSGGTMGGLQGQEFSTVNISGGLSSGNISAFHSSTINITGGTFTTAIHASGDSVVNIRGGNIANSPGGALLCLDNGVINIYGTNLQATFAFAADVRNYYTLSGTLEDGSSLAGSYIATQGPNSSFNLIPAPSAAVMLGLGGLAAMRRRRS